MLLSPHFDMQEFLVSETAARMGREIDATEGVAFNLQRLCNLILEPVRELVERPVIITSGYRPEWLNNVVNGSKNSAHIDGRAADIIAPGMPAPVLANRIAFMAAMLGDVMQIDQLILEFGRWVHVAIAKEGEVPRGELLTARYVDGRISYDPGIIMPNRLVRL